MKTDLFLGLDAGNSKVVALVARADGSIVGSARAGSNGDIYEAASAEAALAPVEEAVAKALESAGAGFDDVACGVFSMAGADWPEDQDFLSTELERRNLVRRVMVVHDAVGALRAGAREGTGVVIVCGTYATFAARAPDGRLWNARWWQEPAGGRFLGERALRACYRAELGIDWPTSMKESVLEFFEKQSVEEVLHFLTARLGGPRPDLGRLAPIILDEAEVGDAVAIDIVRDHGEMLGDYAIAAAKQVGLEKTRFPLVLSGGVFRHPSKLHTEAIAKRVAATAPEAYLMRTSLEPVVGAVLLALESSGQGAGAETRECLLCTMPGPSVFEA